MSTSWCVDKVNQRDIVVHRRCEKYMMGVVTSSNAGAVLKPAHSLEPVWEDSLAVSLFVASAHRIRSSSSKLISSPPSPSGSATASAARPPTVVGDTSSSVVVLCACCRVCATLRLSRTPVGQRRRAEPAPGRSCWCCCCCTIRNVEHDADSPAASEDRMGYAWAVLPLVVMKADACPRQQRTEAAAATPTKRGAMRRWRLYASGSHP